MKSFIVIVTFLAAYIPSLAISAEIIHDSEFQLLQEQYGEKWAAEDKEIEKKLEELQKKHGKRPNIIPHYVDDVWWCSVFIP